MVSKLTTMATWRLQHAFQVLSMLCMHRCLRCCSCSAWILMSSLQTMQLLCAWLDVKSEQAAEYTEPAQALLITLSLESLLRHLPFTV